MEESKADLSEHNDSREGKRRGCWVGGGSTQPPRIYKSGDNKAGKRVPCWMSQVPGGCLMLGLGQVTNTGDVQPETMEEPIRQHRWQSGKKREREGEQGRAKEKGDQQRGH